MGGNAVPVALEHAGIAAWAGTVAQQLLYASTLRHGLNQGDYNQITRLADARRDLIDAWHRAAVALVMKHTAAIECVAVALMAR